MASWDINKLVERKLEYNDRQEAYIQKASRVPVMFYFLI